MAGFGGGHTGQYARRHEFLARWAAGAGQEDRRTGARPGAAVGLRLAPPLNCLAVGFEPDTPLPRRAKPLVPIDSVKPYQRLR